MTAYPSSSFQFAKLFGGLTGSNVTRNFPKKGGFHQNLSLLTKHCQFLKIDIIGI